MADLSSQIAQAKASGYSDSEITSYIGSMPDYAPKVKLAIDSGYSPAEIVAHLNQTKSLVDQIPGLAPAVKPEPETKGPLVGFGGLEAPLSLATGAVGSVVGPVIGLAKGLFGGKYGTAEGVREAGNTAADVAQSLTYHPRTQVGQRITQGVGNALNDSGIIALAPMAGELAALGESTRPAIQSAKTASAAAVDAGKSGFERLRAGLKTPAPEMQGMGAATTADELMRTTNAQSLPVPIDLTKGQRSRAYDQQRFERETAKNPEEGQPLRTRFEDQNDKVLKNFDAFNELTGAEKVGNLRSVGETVTKAIENKAAAAKERINQAYDAAKQAGHMEEPVKMDSVLDFIDKNESAFKNAPILSAAKTEIKRLSEIRSGARDPFTNALPKGDTGTLMKISDAEELRKMINRLVEPGTPNEVYGIELKKLIDSATEGKGGDLYKQARRQYAAYSKEFTDRNVIDKMLRKNPGTLDRAVAYEDVFNHSILKGSLDDVRHVRRVLQTGGEEGAQAWKELQGQTVQHIKDTITYNVSRDSRGNPIVSPDKLNKLVKVLNEDGKLDFIFGKKGAEQIRTVNDLAKDIYTSPPNAINSSNTASVLFGLLDTAVSGLSGVPLPLATVTNQAVKRGKTNILRNKILDALNPDETQPKNAFMRAVKNPYADQDRETIH